MIFLPVMLQLYFEKITELTVGRSSSLLFKEALVSLATDSGLHPLVPYFTYFIADEVNIISILFEVLLSLYLVWPDDLLNHVGVTEFK